MSSQGTWARRLPPLAMGGLALALMVAILPSSLHVPSTGPAGQAEVAPMPGAGQNQSNLSQLGLAESGTVGGLGGSAIGDANPPEVLQGLTPKGSVAQQAHCVGNPPRQTEDPISPPCVPAWSADNGGKTSHGVDGNTITVVAVSQVSQGGDYSDNPSGSDTPLTRTFRTLLRYFQTRFITFGRQVKMKSYLNPGAASFKQMATDIDQRYNHPFAVLSFDSTSPDLNWTTTGMEYLFARNWLSPGGRLAARAEWTKAAPYAWSQLPSQEDLVASAVHWVCNSVQGKPATMANDPRLRLKTRRMALLSSPGSDSQSQDDALEAGTRQLCGYSFAQRLVVSSATAATDPRLAEAVAKAQGDNDTTLFCRSCGNMATLQQNATTAGYLPEWLFADGYVTDNSTARNQRSDQWANATGITWLWRHQPMPRTFWWQAYQQIDATGSPDRDYGHAIYDYLMQLFSGIQLAGAHLTPNSMQQGMEKWHRLSVDPFSPAASYTPIDHTFVKDWMLERWDPQGVAPGTNSQGCYRMVNDGARTDLTTHDWPATDDAAGATSWPCQADTLNGSDQYADVPH